MEDETVANDPVEVLKEVREWIKAWEPPFVLDLEWVGTERRMEEAIAEAEGKTEIDTTLSTFLMDVADWFLNYPTNLPGRSEALEIANHMGNAAKRAIELEIIEAERGK